MAEASGVRSPLGLYARTRQRVSREFAAIDATATSDHDARATSDAMTTFVVAALCLTVMEYLAGPRALAEFADWLHGLVPGVPDWHALRLSRWAGLSDLTLWIATRALGFVVIPVFVIRLVFKRRIRSFGLALPGRLRDLRPYLLLFALVSPLLLIASLRPEFRAYDPFYRRAGESWLDLLLWEGMYAFQFFCVEFFFRGFLLYGAQRRLGSLAVFVAMVPYCMVHFTKPLLEVLGAIPAGIVLGVLALRTGSIWGGVLLHVAVAWTMDVLALLSSTGLPRRLWPYW